MHDHIMRMMDIAAQLKNLEVYISESLFNIFYVLFLLGIAHSRSPITHIRRIGQLANF